MSNKHFRLTAQTEAVFTVREQIDFDKTVDFGTEVLK